MSEHIITVNEEFSSKEEGSLKMSHEELQRILECLCLGKAILDKDGIVRRVNSNFCKMFFLTPNDILNKDISLVVPVLNDTKFKEGLAIVREMCLPIKLESVGFQRDFSSIRYLDFTICPRLQHKQCSGFILIGADVTDKVVYELQAIHSRKLESIGELAAGIAHEINSPIQYVADNLLFMEKAFSKILSVMMLRESFIDAVRNKETVDSLFPQLESLEKTIKLPYLKEQVPQAIREARDGIDRVSEIVKAMKAFSHPGSIDKQLINLNESLDLAVTVARNEWKYVAEIQTYYQQDLPVIEGFPAELNQVFLNILINAAQAIKSSKNDECTKGIIELKTYTEDDYVVIQIKDNGPGIPESIKHRIFDPFFTTKDVGKGTGQGLAIAHAIIVERHRGKVSVESKVGEGASFFVKLPVCKNTSEHDSI